MFKSVLFLLLWSASSPLLSADAPTAAAPVAKAAKTYSEEEFLTEVNKEADRRVSKVRPKNIADFSKELLSKEDELRLMEKKLMDRERQLQINEENFAKKVINLEERQQKILGCMDKNEQDSQKRIEHVVSIVSTMKPEKAAEMLSVQDPEISVRILSQIESARASKIFNLMDKEISARLQKQYMDMKK